MGRKSKRRVKKLSNSIPSISSQNAGSFSGKALKNSLGYFSGPSFWGKRDSSSSCKASRDYVRSAYSKDDLISNDERKLSRLYAYDPTVRKAIDKPVEDALRGGVNFTSPDLEADQYDLLKDFIKDIRLLETVRNAFINARLYGGAGIVINIAQDLLTPLSYENIGGELRFHVVSRYILKDKDDDFIIIGSIGNQETIHRSKVLKLYGRSAPAYFKEKLSGWGFSEVEAAYRNLQLHLKSQEVMFELTDETKLDIFALEGFNRLISGDSRAANLILERVELTNMLKSYKNALIMDKNDEFKQKQINLSGITDSNKSAKVDLAAAFDIGHDIFWGLGSSAFGGGQDTIENYNAFVESHIREPMVDVLQSLLKVISGFLFKTNYTFQIDFKPLRVLSSVDETMVKKTKIDMYTSLADRGYVTKEEVMEKLKEEGVF